MLFGIIIYQLLFGESMWQFYQDFFGYMIKSKRTYVSIFNNIKLDSDPDRVKLSDFG